MLRAKSVWSPIDADRDGLRILATRFRGRGLRATRYHVWMANLGPSERLLRSVEGVAWREFERRYKAELFAPASIDERNRTIKNHGQKFTRRLIKQLARRGNVTLLCHCDEDQDQCHRHVLRRVILSRQV